MKNYIITHNGLFLFQLETKHGATFTNSSSTAKKFTKEEAQKIAELKGYGVREV